MYTEIALLLYLGVQTHAIKTKKALPAFYILRRVDIMFKVNANQNAGKSKLFMAYKRTTDKNLA